MSDGDKLQGAVPGDGINVIESVDVALGAPEIQAEQPKEAVDEPKKVEPCLKIDGAGRYPFIIALRDLDLKNITDPMEALREIKAKAKELE